MVILTDNLGTKQGFVGLNSAIYNKKRVIMARSRYMYTTTTKIKASLKMLLYLMVYYQTNTKLLTFEMKKVKDIKTYFLFHESRFDPCIKSPTSVSPIIRDG